MNKFDYLTNFVYNHIVDLKSKSGSCLIKQRLSQSKSIIKFVVCHSPWSTGVENDMYNDM